MTKRFAIIGAGVSGLACAEQLLAAGHEVSIFEKSRGRGGRAATRRSDSKSFDHGAQYFTVRDRKFRTWADRAIERGLIQEWETRIVAIEAEETRDLESETTRYVGVPGMSAIARGFEVGDSVQLSRRVVAIEQAQRAWTVYTTQAHSALDLAETEPPTEVHGPFDHVVIATPAPQAVPFLAASPDLAKLAGSVTFDPCFAAMLSFEESLGLRYGGAFVADREISWIANDGTKPGRAEASGERWVVHGSAEFSAPAFESWVATRSSGDAQHVEAERSAILSVLVSTFCDITGANPPSDSALHGWRYSIPQPLDCAFLSDPEAGLSACGDWCGGPRVEGAFLSGRELGESLR